MCSMYSIKYQCKYLNSTSTYCICNLYKYIHTDVNPTSSLVHEIVWYSTKEDRKEGIVWY